MQYEKFIWKFVQCFEQHDDKCIASGVRKLLITFQNFIPTLILTLKNTVYKTALFKNIHHLMILSIVFVERKIYTIFLCF